MIVQILLVCQSWRCDSLHVLLLLLDWLCLLIGRGTLLHKWTLRVFYHLEFLNHLLKLYSIMNLSLRLILLVLFALRSCWLSLLHVTSVIVWWKFYYALKCCHLSITFLIVSFEHKHLARVVSRSISRHPLLRLSGLFCYAALFSSLLSWLLTHWLVEANSSWFFLAICPIGRSILLHLVYLWDSVRCWVVSLWLLLYKLAIRKWSWPLVWLRLRSITSLRIVVWLVFHLYVVLRYLNCLLAYQLLYWPIFLNHEFNTIA